MIYNHITNCKGVNYLVDLLNNGNNAENEKCDRKNFGAIIVKENIFIIPNDGILYYL